MPKVATPRLGCALVVPPSVALPGGFAPSWMTTVVVSAPATGTPAESTTLTCTAGLIFCPTCVFWGFAMKTRATGGAVDVGCGPPEPDTSLSRWQPTTSAPSARAQIVFTIIGRACCKCRTCSTSLAESYPQSGPGRSGSGSVAREQQAELRVRRPHGSPIPATTRIELLVAPLRPPALTPRV